MAAQPNDLSILEPANKTKPNHQFYAEANVLFADLKKPLEEKIRPQASVRLPRDGHYQFRQADPFRFEGILSHKGGYTQVAGYPSSKVSGHTTLATSVIEGLNVLDVITADRIVAQISTVHRVYGEGQVPSVTFLGTRFDNLRINGCRVRIKPNLEILGPRHEDDRSYFDDPDVIDRVSQQYSEISKDGLPDWTREEYPQNRAIVQDIGQGRRQMQCSVVEGLKGCPGFPFGHVIDLPHFGKIFLGELKIERTPGRPDNGEYDTYRFHLTMIRLKMGCLAEGNSNIVNTESNGQGGDGH